MYLPWLSLPFSSVRNDDVCLFRLSWYAHTHKTHSQVPQMIENYRLGKADGLSGWFVLQWALGDTCNLVGCLLSQQQTATETYTAVYFILSDVLLGAQYLYYKIKARRDRRLKRMIRESFFSSARSQKDADGNAGGGGTRTLRASSTSARPTTWRASTAVRYESIPDNNGHRDMTTTGGEISRGEGGASFSPGSSSVTSSLSRPLSAAVAMLAASVSVMTTTAAAVPRAGVAAVALGARVERHRRAMMTVMTATAQEPGADPRVSTNLLMQAQNCVDQPPPNRYFVIAGQTLGYVSLFCYISSRIAQIGRNYKRKSVEGLSTTMFVFAMLANLTYGAAILLAGGGEDVVLARLPWLLGSLGTVVLDMSIFAQAVIYGDSPPEYSSASETTTPGGPMSRSESTESTSLLIGARGRSPGERPPQESGGNDQKKPLSAPV